MKFFLLPAALLIGFGIHQAEARGCIKGALVGGVAGHYAGHHALLGAAGGCVVGHHMAKVHEREHEEQMNQDRAAHAY